MGVNVHSASPWIVPDFVDVIGDSAAGQDTDSQGPFSLSRDGLIDNHLTAFPEQDHLVLDIPPLDRIYGEDCMSLDSQIPYISKWRFDDKHESFTKDWCGPLFDFNARTPGPDISRHHLIDLETISTPTSQEPATAGEALEDSVHEASGGSIASHLPHLLEHLSLCERYFLLYDGDFTHNLHQLFFGSRSNDNAVRLAIESAYDLRADQSDPGQRSRRPLAVRSALADVFLPPCSTAKGHEPDRARLLVHEHLDLSLLSPDAPGVVTADILNSFSPYALSFLAIKHDVPAELTTLFDSGVEAQYRAVFRARLAVAHSLHMSTATKTMIFESMVADVKSRGRDKYNAALALRLANKAHNVISALSNSLDLCTTSIWQDFMSVIRNITGFISRSARATEDSVAGQIKGLDINLDDLAQLHVETLDRLRGVLFLHDSQADLANDISSVLHSALETCRTTRIVACRGSAMTSGAGMSTLSGQSDMGLGSGLQNLKAILLDREGATDEAVHRLCARIRDWVDSSRQETDPIEEEARICGDLLARTLSNDTSSMERSSDNGDDSSKGSAGDAS